MPERFREGTKFTAGYTLGKRLGEGGMADVFKATDDLNQSTVAIKIHRLESNKPEANRKYKDLFLKEAKTTALLEHPNIVRFHRFGIEQIRDQHDAHTIEEHPYIVMAYANEGSVRSFLNQHGQIEPEQVVDFLVQAASGLHYAHEQKVLHRDIKPENFLLHKEHPNHDHLDLWVADFGIAITAHPLNTPSPLTPQEPHGTLSYTAWEQSEGEAQIPSDIYSLGVVAYELLTGKKPFFSQTPIGYYNAHKFQSPPSFDQSRGRKGMNDILADMEEVVISALDKDPAKRPQNIEFFAFTLKAAHDKAVEREQLHRKNVDMAPLPGKKQNKNTQPPAQLPQEGQIFLDPNPREEKDEKFFAGSTHLDQVAQEQRKNANASTVFASQDNAQNEHQLPGHQQEAPQQPAVNQPAQAETGTPAIPPKGAQEPRQKAGSHTKESAQEPQPEANEKPYRHPVKALIPFIKGEFYARQGKHEQAVAAYNQALKLDPLNASLHNNLGVALFNLSRNEEALAAYGRAINLEPKDATAYSNRGQVLNRLNRYKEALNDFNQASKLDSTNAYIQYHRGETLIQLDQSEEALKAYDNAISFDPGFALAYYHKGIALYKRGQRGEAIAAYTQALYYDPKNTAMLFDTGNALYELSRYEEAVQTFDRLINIHPENAVAHYNKANSLLVLGRYEEAIVAYNEAIKYNPKYSDAFNNKGVALSDLRQYEEAIAAYEEAIRLNSKNRRAYYNKGNTLYNNFGQVEEALQVYNQWLAIDPTDKDAVAKKQQLLKEFRKAKTRNAVSRFARWISPF